MKSKIAMAMILTVLVTLNAEIILHGSLNAPNFYKDSTQIFGEEVDGPVKSYWDSIKVRGEYSYKKGVLDGIQKEYYSDGKVSAEWNMKEGKKSGAGKEFYDDGSISFHRELSAGGDGFGTEYYRNGMKKRERAYKNGEQVYASKLNHDIKEKRYERTAEELFYEAQEYGALGMYGHAIESYEEFLTKFPKHEKAPDVKFLIAFTYHNSLKEESLAKKHYSEFIKNYPDSPLKVSAEFEMENIGKDIDNLDLFKGKE
jgi:tetratricopeptide (TPR) repeat protein